jgi:ABC-2 type transport system permease protein
MAGVSPLPASVAERPRGPKSFDLFSAVAELRWRLLVNSLRTIRGRLELVSRVFVGFSVTMLALGGAVFLVPLSYLATAQDHPDYLAIALWIIFAFWQLYPVLGSLASVPFEFATLLRFPMTFSTYWWLAFFYGLIEPVCLVSLLWLGAMLLGIGVASPALLPGAALALLGFAILNLLLSRAVYLWLERWLAQRKTREVLGLVFLFLIVGIQFITPVAMRLERHRAGARVSLTSIANIATFFPPGLASFSLQQFHAGDILPGLYACAALGAYSALLAVLLNRRLRAQFLGENLSEAAAPVVVRGGEKVREGWDLRGLSGPIAAIFEKETRYLLRSGPVLFMFVMPIVILVLFRLNPAASGASRGFLSHLSDWAFPVGCAYALLMLTNIVYNSFGGDGSGLQFFLIAPVPMRDVLLAKNISHTTVLAINIALVYIATSFLYSPPRADILLITLAALLFAFPLNLAAGNLMSVYSPKRHDLATFGRQRASAATGFVGMFVQIFVVGVSALVIFGAYHFGQVWLAGVAFLPLAAGTFLVYWIILNKSARAALDRREVLVAEICRVSADATASGRAS